jgi:hypothetical protein
LFEIGKALASHGHHRFAGGGESNAAAGPFEQRETERLLEKSDLLAQRRLGDMEALRGSAEMELFRHGQEVAEEAQVYFFIHTEQISIGANRILDS